MSDNSGEDLVVHCICEKAVCRELSRLVPWTLSLGLCDSGLSELKRFIVHHLAGAVLLPLCKCVQYLQDLLPVSAQVCDVRGFLFSRISREEFLGLLRE